jgi:hypothetical protein
MEAVSEAISMLTATLREFMGSTERSKQVLNLDPARSSITLGRSETCTYPIGKTLGDWAKGIARVQATIESTGDGIVLIDGSREKVSTNGIWVHGEPIQGAIALHPGLELTLFKSGSAKVSLIINDPDTEGDRTSDTYTGQDLLGVLQEQVSLLAEQNHRIESQVVLLAEQLAHRTAIDTNQEQRLIQTEKRLNRVLAIVFACVSAIVFASGWTGGTIEDRKQWSSTFTSIAIGVAALYFKSKENEQKAAKP